MPANQTRLTYLPGLDGLRALAILAVFLYHAEGAWLPGGFLGVESFFVISGFLITSLLLRDWSDHGRIDLKRFWARRALRLLPALWMMLAGTALATAWLAPSALPRLSEDAWTAFFYITNWGYIVRQVPYFETFNQPVLQHLWSLAVEEQVYLIWPLALVALLRMTRGATGGMLSFLTLGAAASSVWMAVLYEPYGDPSRVYFGTDTRSAGFLIGAALAWMARDSFTARYGDNEEPTVNSLRGYASLGHKTTLTTNLLGLLSLAGLLGLYGFVQDFYPELYRGGFALTALLTAGTIGAAIRPGSWLARGLGWRPLRWIGSRSYGIYLWHWPVMVLTRPQVGGHWPLVLEVGLYAALSLAMAEISHRWVEEPIRTQGLRAWVDGLTRRWRARARVQQVATGFVGCMAVVLAAHGAWRPQLAAQTGAPGTFEVTSEVTSEVPRRATIAASPTFEVTSEVTSEVPARATPAASPTFEVTSEVTSEVPARATIAASPTFEVTSEVPARATPAASPTFEVTSEVTSEVPARTTPTAPTQSAPAAAPEVTLIGDSVMLSTEYVWARRYPGRYIMDAAVGRRLDEAPAVIDALAQRGQLLPTVVLHLGSNRMFDPILLEQVVQQLLGHGVQRLLIVNLRRPANWVPTANANIGALVSAYPQTQLVDWWALSYDRNDWFIPDGTHPTGEGMGRYIDAIAGALWP